MLEAAVEEPLPWGLPEAAVLVAAGQVLKAVQLLEEQVRMVWAVVAVELGITALHIQPEKVVTELLFLLTHLLSPQSPQLAVD